MMHPTAAVSLISYAAVNAALAGVDAARQRAEVARRRAADATVCAALAEQSALIARLADALRAERARSAQLEQVIDGLKDEVEDLEGELAEWRSH